MLVDSYLNGRTQLVICGEKESSVGRVTYGVPQAGVDWDQKASAAFYTKKILKNS
jgi:hypothetical protein